MYTLIVLEKICSYIMRWEYVTAKLSPKNGETLVFSDHGSIPS